MPISKILASVLILGTLQKHYPLLLSQIRTVFLLQSVLILSSSIYLLLSCRISRFELGKELCQLLQLVEGIT